MRTRIRAAISLCVVFLMTQLTPVAEASNLAELRWQQRLIVVFAVEDSQDNTQLMRWVTSNRCRLTDRDVLVLSIDSGAADDLTAQNVSLDDDSIAALHQRRQYPNAAFEMLLIGKDGGVKAHATNVDELDTFIERIDGMPMRQSEAKADRC